MRRRPVPSLLLALALLGAAPAAGQAERWTQVASSLPLTPKAVNRSGAVVGTTPAGQVARWTRAGGLVVLGAGDAGCSLTGDGLGITDDGTVLASATCRVGDDTQARAYVFGPSSTVGSSSGFPPQTQVRQVQGDGRFVATTFASSTSGAALTGTATAGVVGTASTAGQQGRAINPAGDTLALSLEFPAQGDYTETLSVNGSARLTFTVTAEDDGELAFLPDASFLVRQRGQPLGVVGSGGSRAPLALTTTAGTTVDAGRFLGGSNAGAKLFGVATSGPGLPAGESAIVAWSDPTQPARLLPILSPAASPQAATSPTAISGDGAYLALGDGELWYDPDAVVTPPPPVDPAVQAAITTAEQGRPVVTPAPGTRIANPSPAVKEVARGEQRFWDRQALRAGVDAGQVVSATTGSSAGGPVASSQGQVALAIYAAFQQRLEFWTTVAQDPPDPLWRTTASAPAVTIAKLGLSGVQGASRSALRTQLDGQLRLAAAERCAADAINRGATAMAASAPTVAAAQYRAGSACLRAAIPVATALPASAKRAASALTAQRRAVRRRGSPRTASKARYARGVTAALGRLGRVVALTPAQTAALRSGLVGTRVPRAAAPDLVSSLRALTARSAGRVGELRALADELDAAAAGR